MKHALFLSAALLISTDASFAVENKTITAADQAKGSSSDVETTRKIRELLMNDPGLSTVAKNVSIVTLDGVVNIKGNVQDPSEMRRVEMTAKNVAGPRAVVKNQMKISP